MGSGTVRFGWARSGKVRLDAVRVRFGRVRCGANMATVDDILELPDIEFALTRWEQDFVDSMQCWRGEPTERQQEILDEIFEKYKEMAE